MHMQRQVKALPTLQATTQNFGADPDECPICHRHLVPSEIEARAVGQEKIEIAFQCTYAECRSIFVGYYERQPSNLYQLKRVAPNRFEGTKFVREIENTSAEFIAIYNQSEAAEAAGYDRIAGVGYRKSLEFLIKDYLLLVLPDKKDVVSKALLGRCIDEYVDDPKIKACAKRAAWLGNDETHYVRKWESKDIA